MNIIELQEFFEYKDGVLFWKKSPNKRIVVGEEAGTISNGRVRVQLGGKIYLAHRIVWAICHGELPPVQIDHKDNDPLNNRIENLRAATSNQNQHNQPKPKNNTSGVKGVSWHKAAGKWSVRVSANNKRINCGLFDDLDLAELVAVEVRNKFHGEYANHG